MNGSIPVERPFFRLAAQVWATERDMLELERIIIFRRERERAERHYHDAPRLEAYLKWLVGLRTDCQLAIRRLAAQRAGLLELVRLAGDSVEAYRAELERKELELRGARADIDRAQVSLLQLEHELELLKEKSR